MDAFRNKDLLLNEEKINISSKSANEYTHPKNNLNKTAISAKMKASTELDNLLEISTFEYSRVDDGRHGIAKDGWDYYKTIFRVNDSTFEGLINIAKNGNTKTLYDITRIKKTSLVGLDETSSSTTRATSFSDNNISQNTKNVKSASNKYSLSSIDSEDRPLTQEQQEFFKDSQVRDENGSMKEINHSINFLLFSL